MDIVVATPLRLAKAAKRADFSSVQYLVFDEADKLLDQAFLRQMDKIVAACSHPKKVGQACLNHQAKHAEPWIW